MRDFKELVVWQKAHRLVLEIYRATATFPSEERYGLLSQVRRSVASVPANIAEGCGRDSERDLARFVAIAAGSASETEYHILLAKDLGYLSSSDHASLDRRFNEVKKMLGAFGRSLVPIPKWLVF